MTAANRMAAGSERNRVRPKKVPEMIADRVRQMIARGEVGDGEWLPTEPELMETFGVSRPTLREAFRLLEADSLITIRRGPPGGARVTIPGPEAAASQFGLLLTLSHTSIQDIYEARMVIEPAAARTLAERGSAAARKTLAAEVERLAELVDTPEQFVSASVQFHLRLVELAGNRTLATVVGMLTEILTRHMAKTVRESSQQLAELTAHDERAVRAYQKLVTLIQAKDGEGAEKFWIRHMRAAREYVLNVDDTTQVVDLLY
ncbi:FadR family transcriptional regulator [Nocardia sp. NBC_00565]|uniref:FadR/GntR family transcriptional regulator n=1 Tax=Nocardia sp. NBC_00565 TaxID=2975993 RepID=UPI002E80406A|nr:FadR/GntR family transcriptional regulator [Nocardia sp. NBC_00565]WUC04727.1 FadR family transcriptional regulator [Nocardia sp. NBC_00565]